MTVLCFWSTQLDLKTKDGVHKLHAGKGQVETKRGENEMKPVMADEEVHTRDSDGRGCSGLTINEGNVFRYG